MGAITNEANIKRLSIIKDVLLVCAVAPSTEQKVLPNMKIIENFSLFIISYKEAIITFIGNINDASSHHSCSWKITLNERSEC